MSSLDKHELEALAYCIRNWARCLPPEKRNKGDEHQDLSKSHHKVRLARCVLKRLRGNRGVQVPPDGWTRIADQPPSADEELVFYCPARPMQHLAEFQFISDAGSGNAAYATHWRRPFPRPAGVDGRKP